MSDAKSLRDEELLRIAAGDDADLSGLSNEELLSIVDESRLPKYDPAQSASDVLKSALQGLTMGHLPQIQAAITTGSASGPKYEEAKNLVRQALEQSRARSAPLAFLGEVGGSMVTPGLAAPKAVGALRSALLGGALSFAQNPGGDVTLESVPSRGMAAGLGAVLGGGLGHIQRASGPFAERMAYLSLGPTKRDVVLARKKGDLREVGRTALDEGVVGVNLDEGFMGLLPRSRETLFERAAERATLAGSRKTELINEISKRVGKHGDIPLDPLRDRVFQSLKLNPDHPDAIKRASQAKAFASGIGGGKPSLSLSSADGLKVDTGKFVGWLKTSPGSDPEKTAFNRELYRALNEAIDQKVLDLSKSGMLNSPLVQKELEQTKRAYGNLSEAKRILDTRVAAEESRRAISPSDYATGLMAGATSAMRGGRPDASIGVGFSAMVANKLLRSYGSQVAASAADLTSRALNTRWAYNPMAFGAVPGSIGVLERMSGPWGLMQTTRDE